VGSIEVGKDADLVIFDAHPLSVYAIPEVTIIDGIVRFNRETDPDDMRLLADPEERFDTAYIAYEEHHRCMQGVDLYEFAAGAIQH
jgi:urease alpha subunit